MRNYLGKPGRTKQGFELIKFLDFDKGKCSLQQSSIGDRNCIWLGMDITEAREFTSDKGWTDIDIHDDYIFGRMLLDRNKVTALVNHLKQWLDTGSFMGESYETGVYGSNHINPRVTRSEDEEVMKITGRKITRKQALKISEKILRDAERERKGKARLRK